jgi:hypothetical protein
MPSMDERVESQSRRRSFVATGQFKGIWVRDARVREWFQRLAVGG